MKKNWKGLLALGCVVALAAMNHEALAQNWSMSNIKTQTTEGTNLMLDIIKKAMQIVGLLGSCVSGYYVFAKGQNSWQYIGGFIVCVLMLGLGLTIFG